MSPTPSCDYTNHVTFSSLWAINIQQVLLYTRKRSHPSPAPPCDNTDHVIFSSLCGISIQRVLLCDRLSPFHKWVINMSPIIGTHTRPTPTINFTYEKPTFSDISLPDRHKSHIPNAQGAGSMIRAYISRPLIRNEILEHIITFFYLFYYC